MIRTIAFGVVCLAAMAAIASAAKRPAPLPLPEIVEPVVASGSKADRLPINVSQDVLDEADRVDVAYVPPRDEERAASPPPERREIVDRPRSKITSRHWHDPEDRKAKKTRLAKLKAKHHRIKQAEKRSDDEAAKPAAEPKACHTDGLLPLLVKLNLSPACPPKG